jgi:hypothetical protein
MLSTRVLQHCLYLTVQVSGFQSNSSQLIDIYKHFYRIFGERLQHILFSRLVIWRTLTCALMIKRLKGKRELRAALRGIV